MALARVLSEDNVARSGGQTKELQASDVQNNSAAPGSTVADALTNLGGVSGLSRVVTVDPGNAGAHQTIQAAIDASTADALSGGVMINVAPYRTYSENLTFPAGIWELTSPASAQRPSASNAIPAGGAQLNGNITFNATISGSSLRLVNFRINGTATVASVGAAGSDAASLLLEDTTVTGAITATAGPGFTNFFANGQGSSGSEYPLHELTGAVNVSGGGGGFLQVTGYRLGGDLTGFKPELQSCTFAAGVDVTDTSTSSPRVSIFNSVGTNVMTVTFTAANGVLRMDRQSAQFFVDSGSILSGTTPTLDIWDASRSVDLTLTNNSAAQNLFGGAVPPGLYEITVSLIVLVAGTAGAITANVLFTDELGAATLSINATPLSVTGTGRANGSRQFSSSGAVNIQWSTTGITTPGALSYRIKLSCRRVD